MLREINCENLFFINTLESFLSKSITTRIKKIAILATRILITNLNKLLIVEETRLLNNIIVYNNKNNIKLLLDLIEKYSIL